MVLIVKTDKFAHPKLELKKCVVFLGSLISVFSSRYNHLASFLDVCVFD